MFGGNAQYWGGGGIVPQGLSLVLSALLIASPVAGRAAPEEPGAEAGAVLVVASEPAGASVYVDGQFVGATPVNVARLAAGDHRVRLVKSGYLENGRIVNVSAGKTSTVQVKLTPDANRARETTQVVSGGGGGGLLRNPWFWTAVGGAGAAAAVLLLTRNSAPGAGTVSVSPATALQGGTTVTFTSQGASDPDGDSLTYHWDFGDGSTGSGQTTTHVYTASGPMNVTLTVSDGKKSATATGSVTVKNLTGTWRGTAGSLSEGYVLNVRYVLTQSGTSVTGTYDDAARFFGTIRGSVSTSSPRVRLNGDIYDPCCYTLTYTADPNSTVDSLTGTYVDPVSGVFSSTVNRQ